MLQQLIALFVILVFIVRLVWQKRKERINKTEFFFWFFFWGLAGLAIVFIREIDKLAAALGFGSRGIDILLYLVVIVILYLLLKYRLRLAKIEKDVTELVRQQAINNRS
jgi:hypothetical protein